MDAGVDSSLRWNDGKGNGHILIILLAIATQRQLCFNKRFL